MLCFEVRITAIMFFCFFCFSRKKNEKYKKMSDILSDISETSSTSIQENSSDSSWNPLTDEDSWDDETREIFKNMIPHPAELINNFVKTSDINNNVGFEERVMSSGTSGLEVEREGNKEKLRKQKEIENPHEDNRNLDSVSVVGEFYPKYPTNSKAAKQEKEPERIKHFGYPKATVKVHKQRKPNGQPKSFRPQNKNPGGDFAPRDGIPIIEQDGTIYRQKKSWREMYTKSKMKENLEKLKWNIYQNTINPQQAINEYCSMTKEYTAVFKDADEEMRDEAYDKLPGGHPLKLHMQGFFAQYLLLRDNKGVEHVYPCGLGLDTKTAKNEAANKALAIIFEFSEDRNGCKGFGWAFLFFR